MQRTHATPQELARRAVKLMLILNAGDVQHALQAAEAVATDQDRQNPIVQQILAILHARAGAEVA